jgi:PKD repeat protein
VQIDGPVGNFTYSPLSGCDSLDVIFKVVGSNVATFTWITGDTAQPVTTLTPTYSYRYHIPGQYTHILDLKDAAGCIVPHIGTNNINVDAVVQAKIMWTGP